MKRLLSILLVQLLILFLSACVAQKEAVSNENHDSVAKKEEVDGESSDVDLTPTICPAQNDTDLLAEAQELPESAYTSPAEENGLTGILCYATGTVVDSSGDISQTDMIIDGVESNYFTVETDYGSVRFVDFTQYVIDSMDAWSDLELIQDITDAYGPAYKYDFPKTGDYVLAYGVYCGYSADLDVAVCFYGLNTGVQALMLEDEAAEQTELPSPTDFFSDEARQADYVDMYESYQYSALYDYVSAYIEETAPDDNDSAYYILDLIEPLLPYEEIWSVSHDDFDDSYSISFSGADEISNSQSVEVNVNGTMLDIAVGFVKSDWLFFDEVSISIDGDVTNYYFKSYDVERDVISGGKIKEYVFCDFDSDVLTQLKSAERVVLRFTNSDTSENYDRTLSQDEINALYIGFLLRRNNAELSNLLYHYNNG